MQRLLSKGWKIGALATAIVLVPTAAFAAIGTFTNTSVAPAVTGTNSSAAAGAAGVSGVNTGGGLNARYGVVGSANGPAGVGVKGTGTKYGVQSVGPFNATGAATFGSSLTMTGAASLKNTTITGTLTQTGAATHNGAVTVNGTTALNDNVTVAGGKTINCTACVTPADVSVPIPGVSVQPFGGSVPNPIVMGTLVFIGPTVNVTVGAGQKIVFDDAIQLGSTAGATISPTPCYSSGGTPATFDGNYLDGLTIAAGTRRDIHISDALSPGAGTYTVGVCGFGSGTLDLNDFSQGYAMVIG